MKTSRKIKIIKIINVLDNVILTTLRSYLNHHLQVKIIEAKIKIVEQLTWQFIWRFTWRFIQKFRIIQHCLFKLLLQLRASNYQGLSIIIQI